LYVNVIENILLAQQDQKQRREKEGKSDGGCINVRNMYI